MENDSLEALKSLIEEELYLIPEDKAGILDQIQRQDEKLNSPQSMEPPVLKQVALSENTTDRFDPNPNPPLTPEEPRSEPIGIRGEFSKGVLVLHEEAQLSPEVMDMLVKMINAVGHSMTEVGLVSSEQLESRSMEELLALNPHIVLKFGRIKHSINALPVHAYEIFSEHETEYLFADSLTVISEDKNLKKKLWTSLQVLFNINSAK